MISANQAREMQTSLPTQTEINAVESSIKQAAKAGKSSVFYYKELTQPMLDLLRVKGYKVKSDFSRNELTITISWQEPSANDYYLK